MKDDCTVKDDYTMKGSCGAIERPTNNGSDVTMWQTPDLSLCKLSAVYTQARMPSCQRQSLCYAPGTWEPNACVQYPMARLLIPNHM